MKIYTDGACSHNGSWKGGWAAVVTVNGEVVETLRGGEPNTTNNRMELKAFLEGLKYSLENKGENEKVEILTDSAYIHNAFSQNWIGNWKKNGWKNAKKQPVANQDLWELIVSIREQLGDFLTIVKVKGHASDKFNNLADKIAVEERDK